MKQFLYILRIFDTPDEISQDPPLGTRNLQILLVTLEF